MTLQIFENFKKFLQISKEIFIMLKLCQTYLQFFSMLKLCRTYLQFFSNIIICLINSALILHISAMKQIIKGGNFEIKIFSMVQKTSLRINNYKFLYF